VQWCADRCVRAKLCLVDTFTQSFSHRFWFKLVVTTVEDNDQAPYAKLLTQSRAEWVTLLRATLAYPLLIPMLLLSGGVLACMCVCGVLLLVHNHQYDQYVQAAQTAQEVPKQSSKETSSIDAGRNDVSEGDGWSSFPDQYNSTFVQSSPMNLHRNDRIATQNYSAVVVDEKTQDIDNDYRERGHPERKHPLALIILFPICTTLSFSSFLSFTHNLM